MPKRRIEKRKRTPKEILRSNGVVVKHSTSKNIWRDVVGFEGIYEVSPKGRVRSKERDIHYENGRVCHLRAQLIKVSPDKDGYLLVSLYKEKRKFLMKVHRIVAEAFIPNPSGLPEVNHKDENKSNNSVYVREDGSIDFEKSNLEWCTHGYNMNYGTRKKRTSEARTMYLFQRFTMGGEYIDTLSNEELEKFGFKQSVIWRASIGKCKASSGFKWHRITVEEAEKFRNPIMRKDGSVVNRPTSSTSWKQFERDVATLFGTKRVPLSGSNSGHGTNSDTLHEKLYIECKVRQKISLWALFEDTEKKAKAEKKTPVVAIKQKGSKGMLLVMRPKDIEKILKEIHNENGNKNDSD